MFLKHAFRHARVRFLNARFRPSKLGSVPGTVWGRVPGTSGTSRPDLCVIPHSIGQNLLGQTGHFPGQTGHVPGMFAIQNRRCPPNFFMFCSSQSIWPHADLCMRTVSKYCSACVSNAVLTEPYPSTVSEPLQTALQQTDSPLGRAALSNRGPCPPKV